MKDSDKPDPRARPPDAVRDAYKRLQRLHKRDYQGQRDILTEDHGMVNSDANGPAKMPHDLRQIFLDFLGLANRDINMSPIESTPILKLAKIPGLYIYPSLLPPCVQLHILDKLFHRDLSDSEHKTNVDLHYDVPRPKEDSSYFDKDFSSLVFRPDDPTVHKAITKEQFLDKKLRWITLGGQYDWTEKLYPSSLPPPFPADIKQLIESIFPMKAEAAIVNLYSPGDTLSLHRDVSEECDQPLVSISLGCDGIFIVGLDGENETDAPRVAVMRLKSGDAVLMSGESRYAWHGVPKVLEKTCPDWMSSWPAIANEPDNGERFARWRGWMSNKRINLNVRQMFA